MENNPFQNALLFASVDCHLHTTERPAFPIPVHWHYYGEIIRVRKGSLKVFREDKTYTLNAGDAIFINPLMQHSVDYGEPKVSGLVLTDGSEVSVDGLFCLRNAIAPATVLKDLALDEAHIIVNRAMETNLPGVFAAGDCTGRPYQIAKSVGEGNIAAHTMIEYLAK